MTAQFGGAIYAVTTDNRVEVSGVEINGCNADVSGGGIFADAGYGCVRGYSVGVFATDGNG